MQRLIIAFLVAVSFTSCTDKVYLFKAKLTSSDINGTSKFGPKNTSSISPVIEDPKLADPEYQFLGRIVSAKSVRDDNAFFDAIYLKGNYGKLDSVYINYLEEAVIPNLSATSNDKIDETLFNQFKQDFSNATSFVQKKNFMFQDKYISIRRNLEKSVYRTISNDIVQSQKVEKIFKGGLEANLKSVLQQSNVELTADLKA